MNRSAKFPPLPSVTTCHIHPEKATAEALRAVGECHALLLAATPPAPTILTVTRSSDPARRRRLDALITRLVEKPVTLITQPVPEAREEQAHAQRGEEAPV